LTCLYCILASLNFVSNVPKLHSFIHSISIAHLQVHYYSEALLTQQGYCVRVSRRSTTGNCKWRTWSDENNIT